MRLRKNLPAIAWASIVLLLTLTPGNFLPKQDYWNILSLDKYVHFFIFFVQVWLLLWGRKQPFKSVNTSGYMISILLGILFGVLIEYIQRFIPQRSFDVEDMIANSIGAGLGAIGFWLASKRKAAVGKG